MNYFTEKKNRVNKDENAPHSPISPVETNKVPNQVKSVLITNCFNIFFVFSNNLIFICFLFKAPILPPKQQTDNNEDGVVPSWRRSGSFRNRMQNTETTNSASTSMFIKYCNYIS